MFFNETAIAGCSLIDLEPRRDARGWFARTWCRQEFAARGFSTSLAQCGTSFNHAPFTLRGLHYQAAPYEEQKLVRCVQGQLFDVVVDLRRESPTFGQWFAAELSAANSRMMLVPPGCAHGFMTLTENTEVFYQMSEVHHAPSARGVRWDDPTLAIRWPMEAPGVISDWDCSLPFFEQILAEDPSLSTVGQ